MAEEAGGAVRERAYSLLGNGLEILEKHLSRRLNTADVWSVLLEEPGRFYQALRGFLGGGADPLLKLVFHKMAEDGAVAATPSELLEAVKRGDSESLKTLLGGGRRVV